MHTSITLLRIFSVSQKTHSHTPTHSHTHTHSHTPTHSHTHAVLSSTSLECASKDTLKHTPFLLNMVECVLEHILKVFYSTSPECAMGWLRLVRSIKLQVSFAKEPYKRDYILQKRPTILLILLIVATPYLCVTRPIQMCDMTH